MKKTVVASIVAVVVVMLTVSVTHAVDSSIETDRKSSVSSEKSLNVKSSKSKTESAGQRKSKTTTSGQDKTTQQSRKKTSTTSASATADMTIDIGQLVRQIADDECSQMIRTAKIEDFYPNDDTTPSGIRVYGHTLNVLNEQMARPMLPVRYKGCDVDKLHSYYGCLIEHSIKVAQTILRVNDEMKLLGNSVGVDDVVALTRAIYHNKMQKTGRLKEIYKKLVMMDGTWHYAGDLFTYRIGSAVFRLPPSPMLKLDDMMIYDSGSNMYAGITGVYRVSSSYSLAKAVEELKSSSKYSKIALDVAKYAEKAEQEGRTLDAMIARKKLIDVTKTGKTVVSMSKILPAN